MTSPGCYVNGVNFAKRQKKSSLPKLYSDNFRRGTPETIVTIDYGTTHCSVYYTLYENGDVVPLTMDQTLTHRVPNCLLFSKDGRLMKFGSEASETYSDKDDEVKKNYYYFEHVKKFFRQQEEAGRERELQLSRAALKDVTRTTTVNDIGGSPFYLRDVIAHALNYLKTKVLESLRIIKPRIRSSDIDWVITVPAIWNAHGKQMMREAGYQAGLCSEKHPSVLKATANARVPTKIDEASPDNLSLALEPEGAAIHCQKEIEQTRSLSGYVIVDAGGGTVDIACHEIIGEKRDIQELSLSPEQSGNFCGGTAVNEEFQKFLGELVDDPGFKLQEPDVEQDKLEWKAEINRLVYRTFESKKILFGRQDHNHTTYPIIIPDALWEIYHDDLEKNVTAMNKEGDMSVQMEGRRRKLKLSPEKMASFFRAPIDETANLLVNILRTHGKKISRVYLVGGFGGCPYFQQEIKKKTKEMLNRTVDFRIPREPDLAVVRGATAFRNDPTVIRSRKANATYGIDIAFPFDSKKHSDCGDRKFYNKDWKEWHCNSILCPFVLTGDSVRNDEIFVTSVNPHSKSSDSATFEIYSTPNKDTKYCDMADVSKLGTLTVQLGGHGLDREVDVVFDITHTEIQVLAVDTTSGNIKKTVVDFLSGD